ncbi:hypothetical protein [Mesorhizobium sp. M7A.F.Ca.ET.027.03.2.1]|uniref:hypothetical protein n=1 Tax=Mesorhizobium sp. M7A.F.Ca.ET.027.03.2.1 TaxID=2496656 RepID=UPI000FCA34C4|nr:hypothetical protein [Mesorhizobium sp. M7A.F.Ca.ET.027.03.2.1]RVD64092.1 hypothetical protein EN750_14290 [Mesorhizobium sp. M7A.F.Ca.ET.027.03.2.1]
MHILEIRPAPPGDGRTLARFDLQLVDGVRLYNLKLTEKPDGRRRVFAPSAFGCAAATFNNEIADQIVRAASAALGENNREQHQRAA